MSFPQHLAMSTKIKALQTKIARRPGHHYYWESLYEEYVMFTENVGDIMSYKYDLGLATTGHSIVSLHITNEVTDMTSPYWGSDSMLKFYFPVNTVGVYTVYVKDGNPVDVYIQLEYESGSAKEYFTNKVAQGQELCFVVTLSSRQIMVSNDFDLRKPVAFVDMSAPYYVAAQFPSELVLKNLEVVSTRPY
ncbi:uncharacterized protein [Dermacentor andersoni]|uniref:uncharacterized protein isoform X2 n=1 Tax=Dermacentor andersoni TaxID=34620 RepID=UPI002417F521|nr:uncharacterized protein LOC129381698 isoform X2 [Dermacentor andersoni]